jgi:beta-lactamase superfamily II metal-dependent hydrolase
MPATFTYFDSGVLTTLTGIIGPCLMVHAFRVEEGLGNACLLQLPDGSCGFVDWGTQQSGPLNRALQVVGKSTIRFVAASHAHSDHTLGMANLLRECTVRGVTVEKFVYPASTLSKETAHLTEARKAALECKIPMFAIAEDSFLAPPGERQPPCLVWAADKSWDVRVLSPSLPQVGRAEMNALKRSIVPGNETSLVVLFRFVGTGKGNGFGRALLPGDATPATLGFARKTAQRFPGLALDNQLFLVPHHGSDRNHPPWVDQHIHGIALFFSPTDSPYHPSSEVLKRIAKRPPGGGRLLCTSYAQCCRKSFASRAPGIDRPWVQPGPCFGDIVVTVPASGHAAKNGSSHPGDKRRGYGRCGNTEVS